MTTLEDLRSLRESLPKGKKDPYGACCPSKRVLLNRALKKKNLSELTLGERDVVEEFIQHCANIKKDDKELIKQISKISK